MRFFYIIIDSGEVTVAPYNASRSQDYRLCKFVYFIDENGHETLLVGSRDTFDHEMLLDCFNRQNKNFQLNKDNLRGAGMFGERYVERWNSEGFDFWTPKELRPRICVLLGKKE